MEPIITTCDRVPVNYLRETVSLLTDQGFSPKIQNGSLSDNNIKSIFEEDVPKVTIHQLLEALEPAFMALDIRPRHNKNYAATFLLAPENEDALILEDDVVPCQNLHKQLEAVNWLITQRKLEKYIIALYSHAKWPLSAQNLNEYPLERFFGLQAMLYSANIKELCNAYHLKYCNEQPADFITRIIAKENSIPVFATTFSLFQHVGTVTTGLGNFHYAQNFLDGTN